MSTICGDADAQLALVFRLPPSTQRTGFTRYLRLLSPHLQRFQYVEYSKSKNNKKNN